MAMAIPSAGVWRGWVLAWFALGMLGAQGAPARDGTLRTTAGVTLKGAVEWAAGGVSIRPTNGEPVGVPVEQWSELVVGEVPASTVGGSREDPGQGSRTPSGGGQATVATNVPPALDPAPGWSRSGVGPGGSGRLLVGEGGWRVVARGAGLRGNSDQFFFVEKRMEVSGQLLGAVVEAGSTNAEAVAGIMLRDNLGEAAAYAFLGQRGTGGVTFQYRQIAGGMTMRVTNVAMPFPAWVRLSRMGGAVVAEVSADGRGWRPFGQANVNLGQNARAGLAVAAGTEDGEVTAAFREPTIGAGGSGYAPAVGFPRIVMRGGSVLVAPVESADDSVVRLGGALAGAMVSMLNVARIEFLAPTPEFEARIEPERPGLILSDGDFLDGTVRGLATNTLTMSSLLLGFRRFSVGTEAAAVQVAAVEPEETAFLVRLANGSELRVRRIEVGAGHLRVEAPLLGALVVPVSEVTRVRRTERER